jgi:putative ABC transport system permease protein
MTFLTVATGDPARMAGPLRQLARSMDSNLPILAVRTMDDVFQQSAVSNFRLTTTIFGSASTIGFGLALVGLYAVVAYQVARRTREIGIRMALGADRPRVLRLALGEAGVMSIVGVALGLALSLAAGRGLRWDVPLHSVLP